MHICYANLGLSQPVANVRNVDVAYFRPKMPAPDVFIGVPASTSRVHAVYYTQESPQATPFAA